MASKRDRLVGQFVNKTKGSERRGERFKVVTKGGVRYHDYGGGRLIADKSGPTKKVGTTAPGGAGIPAATPTPAPAPQQAIGAPATATSPASYTTGRTARDALRAKATGTGARLNVAEANPRYGQRFDVVRKGGTRYHRYGPGRMFADTKRGPGSAAFKPKASV